MTCTFVDTLRKPKILDMSIFDWVGSLVLAVLVGVFLLRIKAINITGWIVWITLWTLFGVVVHYVVGVDTMLGYYLGINPKPKRSEECS